jgi:uncharacterized membrane protein
MNARTFGWGLMTLLALGVACYAAGVAFVPANRSPFVLSLIGHWPFAAIMHFGGGALALAVGAMQFSARLRSRMAGLHRWLGRLYILSIAASGTSGFLLAVNSSAGPWARWAFALLALAWLATTLNGYRLIRQRQIAAHRAWMIRSYALTLAAVTLRCYLPLAEFMEWPMAVAYPAIAWLCWVPNLLVAEWFIRASAGFSNQPAGHAAAVR